MKEQLEQVTAAVNDAIQAEAARLERVANETNQAYSHICNQLALLYDRIAKMEQSVQLVKTFNITAIDERIAHLDGFVAGLRDGFGQRQSNLTANLNHTIKRVDTHSSMVNCFSRLHTQHEQAIGEIQKRLAELEKPKRAAKKKAATKKVARTPRKKRGD